MVSEGARETEAANATVLPAISRAYVPLVLPRLRAARFSIDVVMYQWGWYSYAGNTPVHRLNLEFLAAARRGVRVRALLNVDRPGGNLSRTNGITATQLRRAGVNAKMDTTGQLTHAKLLIIDNEITVVGSHNFSARAMNSNNETSVIIIDKLVASQFGRVFNQLFGRV